MKPIVYIAKIAVIGGHLGFMQSRCENRYLFPDTKLSINTRQNKNLNKVHGNTPPPPPLALGLMVECLRMCLGGSSPYV